MNFMKIMAFIAVLVVSGIQAKLIIEVDQEQFQEIASGKTVITSVPAKGAQRYITDGQDGFYYMYLGNPALELPTSHIRKARRGLPEDVFLNLQF